MKDAGIVDHVLAPIVGILRARLIDLDGSIYVITLFSFGVVPAVARL